MKKKTKTNSETKLLALATNARKKQKDSQNLVKTFKKYIAKISSNDLFFVFFMKGMA